MSVLFVCLGNICRSPTAQAVFRRECPDILCDSAGTANWHAGKPPYGPMQAAAEARGFSLSDLRARQLTEHDFDRFDLIVGMDAENLADIELLRPANNDTRVVSLAAFANPAVEHVPDPYYSRDFDGALQLIENAIAGLKSDLEN